jgi:hypothetical protein
MTEQAESLLGSAALISASGVFLHNQRLDAVTVKLTTRDGIEFIDTTCVSLCRAAKR